MKFLKFLPFLLVLATQTLTSQTTEERIEQAFRAQEALKYDEAIEEYESLMSEGHFSADLYFNIGMAYYAKEDLGGAILYLEKAKKQAPYDQQISTNLTLIQNEQVDGLLPLPTFFLKAWWDALAARLSPNSWAIFAILFSILAASCLVLWSLKKMIDWRKYQVSFIPVFLALAIVFYCLGQSRNAILSQTNEGVITAPILDVFIAPGDDADTDGQIHAGLKVAILDQFEGWMKIRLVDGREGWVKENGLGVI